jgi:HAD superfamily hydrolase (TIGR01549 family)
LAIEAITLDFFNTLIFHRGGRARGRLLVEYLRDAGFDPKPWEHCMLYEIFELHDAAYSPLWPQPRKDAYYVTLASRVFESLGIGGSPEVASRHAGALWHILGPDRFDVFPDVGPTLEVLKERGVPLAVISNWQRGLGNFCYELGLSGWLDHILASAELGFAKPDPRIFREACRRLGVPPGRTLHVGDTMIDDYQGAEGAGLPVVLLDRDGAAEAGAAKTIGSLSELPDLVG